MDLAGFGFDLDLDLVGFGFGSILAGFGLILFGFGLIVLGFGLIWLWILVHYSFQGSHSSPGGPRKLQVES